VPYQHAPTPPMTDALRIACARAVHVVTPDGRVLRAGPASLRVLERLGFRATATLLSIPPLVWLLEAGYWVVARNRPFLSRLTFRR
jgi:predicted DCC family thiol-disulfide oxidoreductase YuxK